MSQANSPQPGGPVRGCSTATSANTPENALNFVIERFLKSKLNTATVVMVNTVQPGEDGEVGSLSMTPLVSGTDGSGNAIAPQEIYNVPYSRMQGGIAALKIDPVPGDIGWAVFCQRDISSVKATKAASNPGSFRVFDQADAIYLGGILNKKPEIYLELTQEREAVLHAPMRVYVETQECIIDAPNSHVLGNLFVEGNLAWGGNGSGLNGRKATMRGGLENTGGTIESNGIVLDTHTHHGVETGNGNTGGPQ